MTEQSSRPVLVLGGLPEVFQGVMQQLVARDVSARGSIDEEHDIDQFDDRIFNLMRPRVT